ncbi:DUF7289 family protein [Natronomonas amylolytica]|uniref:DUF7289 family protein n=1 Tax=Natronomonas amylolytica TaxID=3108498 RepID=UPI00300ADA7A
MYSAGNGDDRGQTSPLSVLLIVSLTITAAVVIVVFGGAALESTQDQSRTGQAEQAMTQFDSRAAQVALGDSPSQNVRIGQRNGNYHVDEDTGGIKIYHENYTDGNTEYIYGGDSDWVSLGAVTYEGGNAEIAYQGGGVWRKDADGGVTMVSPPEFHYREATLTFPLIRVNGTDSAGGSTTARVTRLETATNIYPQPGLHYDGNTSRREYLNPVQDGNMTVEIKSEYCEAWRSYLTERTEGEVSECDSDDTVKAQLVTLGTQGEFSVMRGSTLRIRGQEGDEPLTDFNLTFESDSSSGFNNFEWKMANDDSAEKQFEIYIEATEGDGPDTPVHMHLYYSDDGGDTYHSWTLHSSNSDAFRIEDSKEDATLTVNLLNGSKQMVYEDFGTHDLAEGGNNGAGPVFESGGGDFDESDTVNGTTYNASETASLQKVMQHYFAAAEDLDLTIDERQQGNAGLDPDGSSGTIMYNGGGRVVTYLHITENRIRIELD